METKISVDTEGLVWVDGRGYGEIPGSKLYTLGQWRVRFAVNPSTFTITTVDGRQLKIPRQANFVEIGFHDEIPSSFGIELEYLPACEGTPFTISLEAFSDGRVSEVSPTACFFADPTFAMQVGIASLASEKYGAAGLYSLHLFDPKQVNWDCLEQTLANALRSDVKPTP